MNSSWQVKLGFVIPIIFWLNTLICGFLLGNYSHTSGMVSELGELHTKTQYLFTFGMVTISILSLIFIFRLLKILQANHLNKIPIYLLFAFTISIFGAGIFPYPQQLHGILGRPAIFLIFSPLLAFIFWKPYLSNKSKIFILLSMTFFALGFMVFFPNILHGFIGIKQRFFHLGWSIYFVILSYIFTTMNARSPVSSTDPKK